MVEHRYDVVVVGASLAGCTAARLFAERGLNVALLERSKDAASYKAMCGHWILGGTKATLDRAGLWDVMIAAGAETAWLQVWGEDGWIESPRDEVPAAISLRRMALDPVVRQWAASHPRVDLHLGAPVTGVLHDNGGGIKGVEVARDGAVVEFTGRLVVGADGHRSAVARFAGVPTDAAPNGRFFWWAYYRGLEPGLARVWPADPDATVITPAGDGLHLVGAFATKAKAAAFAQDRVAGIEAQLASLPDAPSLRGAERVSNAIGTSDYPFARRDPLPVPGLALIGDAATATDPLPAVGCGWAFRSAEWLVDAAAPGLLGDEELAAGLPRYRAARSIVDAYEALARPAAISFGSSEQQRAIRRAALVDRELARRLGLFAARAEMPDVLLNADSARRATEVLGTVHA